MSRYKLIISFFFCLSLSTFCSASKVALKDVRGEIIPFDSLKGKWVFINYWASWCQPCLDEIQDLNHFYNNNKAEVALFGVNYDHLPLASQIALIKKYKINYPSLQYDPASALHLGQIRGVPVTFVFNPKGKWVTALYGGQSEESLQRIIAK